MALDPDDPAHKDLRAGTIAAAVLNTVPRKGGAVQPWDLFPSIARPEARRQTAEEQCVMAEAWTVALGGRVVRE